MTRESLLILFGILTVLSPFAGLPIAYLSFVLPVLGLAVVAVGLSLRAERRRAAARVAPSSHEAPEAASL